ncbi:MAG: LytTR family DNA-binding domain-containing protein [Erythrobacter sp.]
MNSPATPSATARNTMARKIVVDLSIMTVIGLVLAFIGPFGTFQNPLAYRLVSWVAFAWIGYAIYSPMSWVVERLYNALVIPRLALWAIAVAIATVPMTAIVWSIGYLPNPIAPPNLEQALTSYFYVLLVGGGITAIFYVIEASKSRAPGSSTQTNSRIEEQTVPDAAAENEVVQPPLIERLPPSLGADVIALEMEDHYVRVHTALGSEMVLMRLRDAIAELDGADGRQVHRSWWVARGAVEDVVRDGRNVRLKLPRNIEAPVSRAQVSELKEAGWI